ncbi:hypothetical protein OGAPHI_006382 [Ogataea philodendri]|uniref:NAD(P)-binding protein n=1 Tax=Ogataea philodendri TaxID=1378263 RepID=A0A9P8T0U5_9ASCO|nr:uncharacterized protein OGAPHI_006382 [Ogataea philodendri]KAH3661534.1 hypothetical protein OGAPHI_006382 [Ogataea philodendri]
MFSPEQLPYFDPHVDRRVCFISGGNSGIGYYTVLHLYLHGYVVYVGGRNMNRVRTAIQSVKQEALERQKSPSHSFGELHYLELDLLNLQSVESALQDFKTREKTLHLLINNAGIMAVPYSVTKDSFEIQLQTNYISHFLITSRLLPLMQDPDLVKDPRIVYVSSVGHWLAPFPFKLSYKFNYRPNILFTWFRYGMAKTAGIQYMSRLAKINPQILCVSVHPGFVMNTNLFSHFTRLPFIGLIFWVFFQIFGYFFGVSNEEGSYATLKCALSNELTTEKDNGKFYVSYGVEHEPSYIARNANYADQNWAWTVKELAKRGYDI